MLSAEHAPMGLNFFSKNELVVKGNSYVSYLFQQKGKVALPVSARAVMLDMSFWILDIYKESCYFSQHLRIRNQASLDTLNAIHSIWSLGAI